MEDLYNGEYIMVWEELDGNIYINFMTNRTILVFTPEQWKEIKEEFKVIILDDVREQVEDNRNNEE